MLNRRELCRFLYLNSYAFLLLICGVAVLCLPAYRISWLFVALQIILFLFFIKQSYNLFSTWKDKKLKYQILLGRNRDHYRPDTFKIYMEAPCGRLLARAVLKDLGLSSKYRELLVYKTPLKTKIKNGFKKTEYHVYINEDFR